MAVKKKKLPVADVRWTPVRHGLIYCSPGCGGQCTFKAWTTAWRKAKAVAAQLGNGWTPQVHENLGWHWSVYKGDLFVYLDHRGYYWTNFATFHRGHTPPTFHDPRRAVATHLSYAKHTVRLALARIAKVEAT